MRPEALNDENLSEAQRQDLYRIQMEYHQTGKKPMAYYTYDLRQVQERSQQMSEFKFYRKKFEKSQRARANNTNADNKNTKKLKIGQMDLDVNQEMFDPQKMQQ